MLLAALVDYAEVVLVQIGIVAIDFDHLGNKAPAWSPFELHNHVQRISDVGLNGTVREVNPTLKNTARESCEALLG